MKLCLLIFVQTVFAVEEWNSFKVSVDFFNPSLTNRFKVTYHKVYQNPDEENFRQNVFLENLKLIKAQNEKYEQGLSSFSVGVNRFTDLSKQELFSSKPSAHFDSSVKIGSSGPSFTQDVPDSIDWRDFGVISRVYDQLLCQSCWAFAVVSCQHRPNFFTFSYFRLVQSNPMWLFMNKEISA